ncbi:hypothetical protein [Micromonospora humida]|uniref:restriction endonuclease subunit S n=1 Tax=Micromonospora humida TaxID=2809018 RepID=UPI00340CDAAC
MSGALLTELYPVSPTSLPAGWELRSLGELVTDARSGFSSGSYNSDGVGIPHLRPMNIDRSGCVSLNQIKYVAADASSLRLQPGDIIFNNTNSREHVGKSAVFDLVDAEWGFSNHITRLRLQQGLLPQFVAYQLLYLWECGYFRFHAKQHVNQASISTSTLTNRVPLLVAPPSEQQDLIDRIERNWSVLDSIAMAVDGARSRLGRFEDQTILDAIGGRLVPTEAELAAARSGTYISGSELLKNINDRAAAQAGALFNAKPRRSYKRSIADVSTSNASGLPDGWAQARVDEVGLVTLGKKREPRSHSGPYMRPYLRVANVYEDRIDVSDVLEMNFPPQDYMTYRLEHGDILLNEGQSPELVGRPAMYRGELPGGCFQMTLLRFRAHPGVSATFALLVFRAYLRTGRFREAARWSTNIAHLSTQRFAALPFPLPPLEEQERIVEEATRRLHAAENLSQVLSAIGDRVLLARQASLRAVFPGAVVEGAVPVVGEEADQSKSSPAGRRTARRSRAGGRNSTRVDLLKALADAETALRPEELFDASGYSEELIDEFYSDLRRHIYTGTVTEVRDAQGEPFINLAERQ